MTHCKYNPQKEIFPCIFSCYYRDDLIEQLMREIVDLKAQRDGLLSRLEQLEAELNDYKDIAEQTCNVSLYRLSWLYTDMF